MDSRIRVAAVALLSLAVIAAGAYVFLYSSSPKRSPSRWQSEGPKLLAGIDLVGASGSQQPSMANFTQLTQQFSDVRAQLFIYSPMPDSLAQGGGHNLSTANQTDNPYEVQLYNGTSNQTGVFTGYLSDEFYSIVSQWESVLSSNNMSVTTGVSLEMYAVLQYVSASQLLVYQFYNNIPFDPFNSSLQHPVAYLLSGFNIPLYFDLGRQPLFAYPLNSSAAAYAATGNGQIGGNCNNCKDTSSVIYTNISNTVLPLVVNNLTTVSENSLMTISTYQIGGKLSLSFNSNSGSAKLESEIVGYPTMSERPSWQSAISDTTGFGGSTSTVPTTGHNVSVLGIPAKIQVVRTKFYYVTCCAGTYCELTGTSYSTSISVVDSPTYNATVEFMTQISSSPFWGDVLGSMGFLPIGTDTVLASQAPPPSVNMTDSVSAYTNAASAEAQAVTAAGTFIGVVGQAMAIATAASALPVVGTVADAVNDVNVALAAAGLSLAILTAFTSICFSANIGLSTTLLGFTNMAYTGSGNTLYVHELESSTNTSLTLADGTYTMNTPSLFFDVSP